MENRQFGSQTAQATQTALTPVRNAWKLVGNVLSIVGASLLGAGILLLMLSIFFTSRPAVLSLAITGAGLALPGVIQLIIGVVFRQAARREQANLARLKTEGHSFPAQIVKIERQLYVQVGRSVSAYAECTYQNSDGKTCLVKSRSFLHDSQHYTAWVYVNPFDPTDYAVEIFTQMPQANADYDYR